MINNLLITDNVQNHILDKKPLLSPKTSENRLGKIFQLDERVYWICPKRCRLFPQGSNDECSCGEQQFKSNGKPVETMSYFPLARQLSNLIADTATCEMIQDLHEPEPGQMNDIFDGSIYKKFKLTIFQNEQDTIAISLFVDGFAPFKGGEAKMTIVHVVLLSLPPMER